MSIKFRRLSDVLIRRWGVYMDRWTHAHWCPACAQLHDFAVELPFHNGHQWSFDGNAEKPTFNPSMNIATGPFPDGSKKAGEVERCHYFLHAGRIQFLNDCTHAMKGQTVDLPPIPAKATVYMQEAK